MPEGKAIVLFWTKNGNTEKVARRIHDTLKKAGMKVSISHINKDDKVEYLDYNLIFLELLYIITCHPTQFSHSYEKIR